MTDWHLLNIFIGGAGVYLLVLLEWKPWVVDVWLMPPGRSGGMCKGGECSERLRQGVGVCVCVCEWTDYAYSILT